MKVYRITETIQASPEKIWAVITDAANYPNWNVGVDKIEGNIALGKKIKIFAKISPGRAFPAKVSVLETNKKMVWTGGAPFKFMFKGERTFTLTEENGATKFDMQEVFTGLMSPLILPSIPDLTPSFEEYVKCLKAEVE